MKVCFCTLGGTRACLNCPNNTTWTNIFQPTTPPPVRTVISTTTTLNKNQKLQDTLTYMKSRNLITDEEYDELKELLHR